MATDNSLQAVNDLLLSITESSVQTLSETSEHILAAGGKRLRPHLVLLSYEAVGGQNQDYVIPLAAAVEIIHTATLVHDDINDHGTLRRGRETVNARWGRTFALLTGDYMFTKTYEIMAPYPSDLNKILAQAAIQLVEGETLQIQASKQGTLDRAMYFEIIAKKTAALFVACAEMGATAGNAPPDWIDALRSYAFNIGLAFQITDDLLDLSADPEQIGKNSGIDLAQGRGIAVAIQGGNAGSTSPTITVEVAQDTAPGPFKESILEGHSLADAIRKGRKKAQELANLAIVNLDVLPSSPAVDQLRNLADQITQRDH